MLLLAQVQLLDDRAVTLDIDLLQVAQKVSSVADHLQHAAAAVVVLVVALEVLCESLDSLCEKCDLHLGRTCVALVSSISLNNCRSEGWRKSRLLTPYSFIGAPSRQRQYHDIFFSWRISS